jgi:hypothetical protein
MQFNGLVDYTRNILSAPENVYHSNLTIEILWKIK